MTIIVSEVVETKNWNWLITAIAQWLKRSDLTAIIPDLIMLAETKMREDLDAKAMEATATLTTVAANAFLDLPSDFRGLRSISIPTEYPSSPQYISPEQMAANYLEPLAGRPFVYTIIAQQLKFAPVPDAAYPIEIMYERMIPRLSSVVISNWLLERSPNAYLFGALMMAQPYIHKDERMQLFASMYTNAIDSINLTDWHTATPMRMRSDVRVC